MLRKIIDTVRLLAVVQVMIFCFCQSLAEAQPIQLKGAHFSVQPGSTRFIFALSNAVSYVISPVKNNQLTLKMYNTVLQCSTANCGITPSALLSTVVADYRLQSKEPQMVQAIFTFRHSVNAQGLSLLPTKSHGYLLAIDFMTQKSTVETPTAIQKITSISSKKRHRI